MKLIETLALLALAVASTARGADFMPLANGNTWTYEDAATGQSFEVRVGTPVAIDQNVYYNLRGYTPNPILVRANEFGNLVYRDQERETDVMLTSFEVVEGATFEAHGRECPEWGKTHAKRGTHDGPAGPWNVLEITYQPYACADAGDLSEQYAENIGMVRRVVNTIAGPRTYDLVYARVGKQVISAGQVGRFSVTAVPDRATGTWKATLRLEETSGIGIKLRFPSSQEYDLRLRDSNRNVLWSWSADKLFALAFHEINASIYKATVTVPNPPAIPEGLQVYVLEAWLTTAQNEPQFAAATIVEVPASTTHGSTRTINPRR